MGGGTPDGPASAHPGTSRSEKNRCRGMSSSLARGDLRFIQARPSARARQTQSAVRAGRVTFPLRSPAPAPRPSILPSAAGPGNGQTAALPRYVRPRIFARRDGESASFRGRSRPSVVTGKISRTIPNDASALYRRGGQVYAKHRRLTLRVKNDFPTESAPPAETPKDVEAYHQQRWVRSVRDRRTLAVWRFEGLQRGDAARPPEYFVDAARQPRRPLQT